MTFHAVSTFNAAGLDLYGRKMAATFCQHWPTEVPLTVYSEGWSEPLGSAQIVDLYISRWLARFKDRHRDVPDAHGKARREYSFIRDAVRFSHKVAAVIEADRTTDADHLIWIDGDLFTRAKVTLADLAGLAPGAAWISWLWRSHTYPECGFYILNRRHPGHAEAMLRLRYLYDGGRLLELPQTHDSYVLAHVVHKMALPWKSLSGAGAASMEPAEKGPLSKWFVHLKGQRKYRQ
jgi:hypothetical protein